MSSGAPQIVVNGASYDLANLRSVSLPVAPTASYALQSTK
jgi:hypothetical protein